MNLVCEYKHKIGFKGPLLIEPKPREPSKHQYDFDSANVVAFLQKYGLSADDFRLNIENNHATLAGHTFEHEVAYAFANDRFGSIDMNRGDLLLGWDTDQFPINLYELVEAMLPIMEAGGFKSGGINFDAKTRRNSTDMEDIFIAHIAGMDVFARAFEMTLEMLEKSAFKKMKAGRYASFDGGDGARFEKGELTLEQLSKLAKTNGEPQQLSGKQELYESIINQFVK